MRILMIAPTPFFADRGCHVRILEETKALKKLGHEVLICTYHCGKDIEGIETRRILKIPWYQKLEAGPSWHKFYLDFLLLLKSFFVALKFKPSIIHAHLHEGAFIGKILSLILRKPLIFDYQGSLTAESVDHGFFKEGSFLHRFASFMERKIDFWSDLVISSAPQNIKAKKLVVLYDGVDTETFRPGVEKEDLKEFLGIRTGDKVVTYLGILGEYQGTDILLLAAKEVKKRIPAVKFLVMGYPYVTEYKSLSRKLEISENIVFTGRVDYRDAPTYLCLGDVAVAPKVSKTEANQKILNYMACGLATVAFDTPVNREMIGDTGLLVSLGDRKALADALTRMLTDDEAREEFSRAARRRAEEEFSWDRVGERLEEIYQEILRSSEL